MGARRGGNILVAAAQRVTEAVEREAGERWFGGAGWAWALGGVAKYVGDVALSAEYCRRRVYAKLCSDGVDAANKWTGNGKP